MIETIIEESLSSITKNTRILSPPAYANDPDAGLDTGGDDFSSKEEAADLSSIIFLTGVFVFIFLFTILKYWICEGPLTARQKRRALDDRKKLIRDRVVSKTVIKRKAKQESSDEEESETHSGAESLETGRTDDEDEEHDGGGFIRHYCRQKTNLEISTSLHNPADGGDDDDCPTECPICFADFEIGDKICWSNNPDCVHTFHIACLEPWLMKHDECPLCRAEYLVPPKEVPPASETETQGTTRRGLSPITRRVVAALSLLFFFRRTVQTLETSGQDEEQADGEIMDSVPEISVYDDDLPSPNLIPLEEGLDCSTDEEDMTAPVDIESRLAVGVR